MGIAMKWYVFCWSLVLLCSVTHTYFEREKAAVCAHQEQWDAAHEQHVALLANGCLDDDLLYDTGVCSYKVGDFEHAISYFDHVTQSDGASDDLKHDAHYNCGNAHAMLSDFKQAAQEYERALLYDPDDQEAKDNLEIVKKMQDNQDNQGDSNSSGGDSSDQNDQNNGQNDQQQDQSDQNDQSSDQSQPDSDQGQDDQPQDNQSDETDSDQSDDQQESDQEDQQDGQNDSTDDSSQQEQDSHEAPDDRPESREPQSQEQQKQESPRDRDKQGAPEQEQERGGQQQEADQGQRDDTADGTDASDDEQGGTQMGPDELLDDGQDGFFGKQDDDTPEWITQLLSQQDEEDALMNQELALRQMKSGAKHDTHNNW